MHQIISKTILVVLILWSQSTLFSQVAFTGKTFINESQDKIEFYKNDSCSITFFDGILPVPWRGHANYSIRGDFLKIKFQKSCFIDTSHYDIVNSLQSDSTIARICVIVPEGFFRMNSLEIGVLRNNFVLSEAIYKDSTFFQFNGLDTLCSKDLLFVNSIGYEQVSFPIRFDTETLYNVYLYPYKNIIRNGTFIYRVSRKRGVLSLKLKTVCDIDKAFIERLIGRSRFKEN